MRLGYRCRGGAVYEPAEDTWQTVEAAEEAAGRRVRVCVELGAGRGVVAETVCRARAPYTVIADIDPCALEEGRRLIDARSDAVQGDNASWIRRAAHTLIVFNTPYLPDPCTAVEELQWCGGLREALRLLTLAAGSGCRLVVTFSSLSGSLHGFLEYAAWLGYRLLGLRSRRMFFETLYTATLDAGGPRVEDPPRARRNRGGDQPRHGGENRGEHGG